MRLGLARRTTTEPSVHNGMQATGTSSNVAEKAGSIRPIRWDTDATNAPAHTITRRHLTTSSRSCSQNCVCDCSPKFRWRAWSVLTKLQFEAGAAAPLAALASDGGRLVCAPLLGGAAWLLAHCCRCCCRSSTRLCRSSLRLEGPDAAAALKGGRCQALRAPQAGPGAQDGAGGLGGCLEALWQGVRALWQLLGPSKAVADLQMRTGEGWQATAGGSSGAQARECMQGVRGGAALQGRMKKKQCRALMKVANPTCPTASSCVCMHSFFSQCTGLAPPCASTHTPSHLLPIRPGGELPQVVAAAAAAVTAAKGAHCAAGACARRLAALRTQGHLWSSGGWVRKAGCAGQHCANRTWHRRGYGKHNTCRQKLEASLHDSCHVSSTESKPPGVAAVQAATRHSPGRQEGSCRQHQHQPGPPASPQRTWLTKPSPEPRAMLRVLALPLDVRLRPGGVPAAPPTARRSCQLQLSATQPSPAWMRLGSGTAWVCREREGQTRQAACVSISEGGQRIRATERPARQDHTSTAAGVWAWGGCRVPQACRQLAAALWKPQYYFTDSPPG